MPITSGQLCAGDCLLEFDAARGGAILRFDWCGEPILRRICGPSILDVACFPLVPFSNRIAHGRFAAPGQAVALAPNFPGTLHPHPLHGFGWLAAWDIVEASAATAVLEHRHEAGEWPWPYRAVQSFELGDESLDLTLAVENLASTAMPAGLGFHPYFPRDPDTLYCGLHRGEWRTSEEGLPLSLDRRLAPIDWWAGAPAGSRSVDTVYTERSGPLEIGWPSRGRRVVLQPSDNLSFTVVYTPAGAPYFCVEPVSHMTDAVNRAEPDTGLRWLEPGETMSASVRLSVGRLG